MSDDAAALAEAADELYALAPEEFVSERNARAKQVRGGGNRDLATAICALPKPTVAAWLLNQLARRHPDAVEQLAALGGELRAAQQNLSGDQLRALTRQRQDVVAGFVAQVHALAAELGRSVSDQVAQQVEETLRAAVADGEAAEALRGARLTTSLSYVGLGEVDVAAAVAVPARATREAEAAHRQAAEQVQAARQEVRRQGARSAELSERAASLRAELARVEDELAAVSEQLRAAERREGDARRAAERVGREGHDQV